MKESTVSKVTFGYKAQVFSNCIDEHIQDFSNSFGYRIRK